MKKNLLLGWAAATAVLLTGACNKAPQPATETETGTVVIKPVLDGHELVTRAADTDNYDHEASIYDMQLLVFDASGYLEHYSSVNHEMTDFLFDLRVGNMKAWIVANGPNLSAVKTESALTGMMINLASYNNPSEDFIMAGTQSFEVTAGDNLECTIPISRLVSRITLKSVTSLLPAAYGTVTIDYAMLENVVSSYSLNGNAGTTGWYNPMGRISESTLVQSHIVNPPTYAADQPQLTFRTLTGSTGFTNGTTYNTPQRFYAYPNATATDHTGFASTFTPRYTRLVLKANIDGGTYYYPVSLPNLARNKSYDVHVTLIGLGSSDPDQPVQKGMLDLMVQVTPWAEGSVINESI